MLVAASLSSTFPLAAGETVTLSKLAGEQVRGTLSDWSTESVTIDVNGRKLILAAADLLDLEVATPPQGATPAASTLTLLDGSRLAVASFEMHEHTAKVESAWSAEPLLVPTTQVQWLQLAAAQKVDWLAEWEHANFSGDVLVVVKADGDSYDFLSGVIQQVTPTHVEFTWEGETLPVKVGKLAGLSFYHAPAPPAAEPLCRLHLSSGEVVVADKVELAAANLQVTTVSGLTLDIPLAVLARADYSVGKLQYLSDCQPVRQQWTPLIALPGETQLLQQYGLPRLDVSWDGSPLALVWPIAAGGEKLQTYSKGLALRSRTELEYRVPASMNRFLATAGIAPATASQGQVELTIELDGQVAWEQSLDGLQSPVGIDLDVSDRRRLKIIVDYGQNLDLGDYLHLVEARWSK